MTTITDITRFKNALEAKKTERDKLIGKQESLMEKLKALGFDTIQQAEDHLDSVEEILEQKEKALAEELSLFQKEFGGLLV